MIIDLNLKGKQVLVIGGGNEAARKVEALLTQECDIIVVSEKVDKSIIKGTGWMMFGSTKPNATPYQITHVLKVYGNNIEQFEQFNKDNEWDYENEYW